MPTTYRILHASDLHLSEVPYMVRNLQLAEGREKHPQWWQQAKNALLTGHDEDVLEAFAQFVYLYGPKGPAKDPLFDHVLITGDLATTGYVADLERAYRFLTSPGVGAPWLGAHRGLPDPTIGFLANHLDAMPGNHDRYQPQVISLPGGTEFDLIFNDAQRIRVFWDKGQGVDRWQVLSYPGGRPLIFMAADLTLTHNDLGSPPIYGYWGQGRACANRIRDLVTETTQAIQKYRSSRAEPAVVWAIHFDAMTQSGTLALLDSHNLLDAAKRQRIPILLCGHTHCSRAQPVLSSTVAFVCGTTTQGASTNPAYSSEMNNDFCVLDITLPDASSEPPIVRPIWFRYRPPSRIPATVQGPVGRFVQVG
jgi:hypothetical protein